MSFCKTLGAFALALSFTSSALAQTPLIAESPAVRGSGGANLGSAQMYAYVAGDGTLDENRSKGTLPCTEAGGKCRSIQGRYRVNFARDVSRCAYSVTADGYGVLTSAQQFGGGPNTVYVGINVVPSTATDIPFRLLVIC
jgi:hypothetical protein